MPKIPLYNQGAGPTAGIASGKLSPGMSISAATAPGRAYAGFQKTFSDAGNVAQQFALREKEAQTTEARSDLTLKTKERWDEFNRVNTAQTVPEYEAQASAFQSQLQEELLGGYEGFTRSQKANLSQSFNQLSIGFSLAGKQTSYNRNLANRGRKQDEFIEATMETMRGLDPSDPTYEFLQASLAQSFSEARTQGLTLDYDERKVLKDLSDGNFNSELSASESTGQVKQIIQKTNDDNSLSSTDKQKRLTDAYSRIKAIDTAERNETRIAFSIQISDATTNEELDEISNAINKNVKNASDFDILSDLISNRKETVVEENIALASGHIDFSNIRADSFADVKDLQEEFEKAKNGDFGDNQVAQDIWNNSSESDRKLITEGMQKNITQARTNLNFYQKQRDNQENEENEKIYSENIGSVRNGTMSLEEIDGLPFVGAEGSKLQQQLKTAAVNLIENAPLTSDNFTANKTIVQMVQRGEITSLTQKFNIPLFDPPGEEYSILERENIQLSSRRVDDFFKLFKADEKTENTRKETIISNFVSSKEISIRGSSLLINKPTPASNKRMEVFESVVREQLRQGLEDGKNFDDMLNILHPDYIMPQNKLNRYIPSKESLTQEAKELFNITDNISGYSIEDKDIQPPSFEEMGLSSNASQTEILNNPIYQAWESSFAGEVFQQLSNQ